jgi:hypothetical protein
LKYVALHVIWKHIFIVVFFQKGQTVDWLQHQQFSIPQNNSRELGQQWNSKRAYT